MYVDEFGAFCLGIDDDVVFMRVCDEEASRRAGIHPEAALGGACFLWQEALIFELCYQRGPVWMDAIQKGL